MAHREPLFCRKVKKKRGKGEKQQQQQQQQQQHQRAPALGVFSSRRLMSGVSRG